MAKINTKQIFPNKYNLRTKVIQKSLIELSNSMRNSGGNIVNIRVRKRNETEYEIVFGYLRWLAACQEGITEINCEVVDISDEQMLKESILENILREPLMPVDRAKGFKLLIEEFGFIPKDIGAYCSKTESWVLQQLSLIELPKEVQEMMEGNILPITWDSKRRRKISSIPVRFSEIHQVSDIKLFCEPKGRLKPSIAIKIRERYKEPKKIKDWCNAVIKHNLTQKRTTELMNMMDKLEKGDVLDVYPQPTFWLPPNSSYSDKIKALINTWSLKIEIEGKLYKRLEKLKTLKQLSMENIAFEALDIGLKQLESQIDNKTKEF